MKSRFVVHAGKVLRGSRIWALALSFICLGWFGSPSLAKEPSLVAIELYDGSNGASYVQLTDVLINSRAELRECPQCLTAPIDRSAYGKLDKLTMGPGGVLERGADGILRYSVNHGSATIVVPFNVKFEHSGGYSASELADLAVLRATPIGSSGGAAPPIKRGVTLVFVAAPDTELAEYLRAQRAADVPGWQSYLAKYPGASHSADAKSALASLFVGAGEAALSAYDKSAATPSPSYSDLKTAKSQADQAHALVPGAGLPAVVKLDGEIRRRLTAITDTGRGELNAYHAALDSHTAGLAHLQNAKKYAEIAGGIDSYFPAFQTLQGDILQDSNKFQSSLRMAESARDVKQFDQALTFVLPYRAFFEEEPRVAAIIDADYSYHFGKGKQAEVAPDWAVAIREYEKAGTVKDTAEARDSLKNAREQMVVVQDKAAADKALESSKDYEQTHDIVRAYEVLSNLPPTQRVLVADDIERLKPAYIQSSSQAAKDLRQAHEPIRGLADEIGLEKAYSYLQRAYELSGNESFRDRMDLLGNELSAYFLEQAKHYLAKPAGSGTELGWMYLTEARPYKASNLDAVRDAMVAAEAAHSIRSKLSIRVQFRDQTSQRDSAGFAGQLENAIITGLEGSGIPVKVVRAGETTSVEPDFQLAGDVLQHHLSVENIEEAVESHYRAGEKEEPSPEWNKANREYEKAEMELQTAQTALQGAEAKGNKKEVTDLNNSVHDAEKKVEDAHVLLDSTPRTVTTDIVRPYTYTKKTVNIAGVIQMQFRIGDSFSGQMAELVPITKEDRKQYILLENVKPEDTEGVKESGPMPDSAEFITTVENAALDALIAAVRKRVEELPRKIYTAAHSQENESDLDGAGESYLRFVNITKDDGSPERKHANAFLQEQFNMRPVANSTP